MKKFLKLLIMVVIIINLTGCCTDESYNKAKCNDIEYDIISIRRWSSSNYELKLKNGEVIEVHPINCVFYN